MILPGRETELVWLCDSGVGYLAPDGAFEYGPRYFENYAKRQDTSMGRQLTNFRLNFVRTNSGDELMQNFSGVCDVGIGAGGFLDALEGSFRERAGFDINPVGVRWLVDRELFVEPLKKKGMTWALTFWDVLEHIEKPWEYLALGVPMIFLTIPIFSGPDDARHSKHYKPNEHIWYWTEDGLLRWFRSFGYVCAQRRDDEKMLGRESVVSMAFRKLDDGLE